MRDDKSMERASQFHNCVRSNCSIHDDYMDCENAIAAALKDYHLEMMSKALSEKQYWTQEDVGKAIEEARAEGYKQGCWDGSEKSNNDNKHFQSEVAKAREEGFRAGELAMRERAEFIAHWIIDKILGATK